MSQIKLKVHSSGTVKLVLSPASSHPGAFLEISFFRPGVHLLTSVRSVYLRIFALRPLQVPRCVLFQRRRLFFLDRCFGCLTCFARCTLHVTHTRTRRYIDYAPCSPSSSFAFSFASKSSAYMSSSASRFEGYACLLARSTYRERKREREYYFLRDTTAPVYICSNLSDFTFFFICS